jgi:hypothetical protein
VSTLRDCPYCYGSCPYCGRPCVGRTCHRHRDLPALDFMAELRRLVANDDARIERAIMDQYR